MDTCFKISNIRGREILDSRGNPTVEAEVFLECGVRASASVPSGASTGDWEACEKRDEDIARYNGKGVLRAAGAIDGEIRECILQMDSRDQAGLDLSLCALDGTKDKSRLGANAILAVSLACAKAAAKAAGLPLYKYLGGAGKPELSVPMMNVINGGVHAGNGLDTQEFMIMPVGETRFHEMLRKCAEVYHALKKLVKSSGVGDEGGFAANISSDEEAIEKLLCAIEKAGFEPGKDFVIALDAAASEWYDEKSGVYNQPKSGRTLSSDELVEHWARLCRAYPIRSIEDGCADRDTAGWQKLTQELGKRIQLVGDDLFVTNAERIQQGMDKGVANAVLIKPNQVGTLTEAIEAMRIARRGGYACVMSHRSGETEDTFIADLAVAFNVGQVKFGAPCRTDRVAKYNRLLRIEDEMRMK
ncbi:MAG: phosphopyruvate hydratase [Oscillospiraceae bacterium]|nr:phosphopyruvate hydratase [Oscillospiraceae bacterium]